MANTEKTVALNLLSSTKYQFYKLMAVPMLNFGNENGEKMR
jgi:hypothetical protein